MILGAVATPPRYLAQAQFRDQVLGFPRRHPSSAAIIPAESSGR